jgi:hypothetical protein
VALSSLLGNKTYKKKCGDSREVSLDLESVARSLLVLEIGVKEGSGEDEERSRPATMPQLGANRE